VHSRKKLLVKKTVMGVHVEKSQSKENGAHIRKKKVIDK
jgi:hypothetical protein